LRMAGAHDDILMDSEAKGYFTTLGLKT